MEENIKEIIKNAIEDAKNSSNKENWIVITKEFVDFFKNPKNLEIDEIDKIIKENKCNFSIMAEGMMAPKLYIKYIG